MQIKPFFKEYKEIKRIPLCKDGRNENYSFVHFKGKTTDGRKYNEWRVMSDTLTQWANKATSYEENLFFPNESIRIFGESYFCPKEIGKFELFPVYAGPTGYITNGIQVYVHIRKIPFLRRLRRKLNKLCHILPRWTLPRPQTNKNH